MKSNLTYQQRQARKGLNILMVAALVLSLTHYATFRLGRRSAFKEVGEIVHRIESAVGAAAEVLAR